MFYKEILVMENVILHLLNKTKNIIILLIISNIQKGIKIIFYNEFNQSNFFEIKKILKLKLLLFIRFLLL